MDLVSRVQLHRKKQMSFFLIQLDCKSKKYFAFPKYISYVIFSRMDNPVLTLHLQSNVCWLCEQHLKNKKMCQQ